MRKVICSLMGYDDTSITYRQILELLYFVVNVIFLMAFIASFIWVGVLVTSFNVWVVYPHIKKIKKPTE